MTSLESLPDERSRNEDRAIFAISFKDDVFAAKYFFQARYMNHIANTNNNAKTKLIKYETVDEGGGGSNTGTGTASTGVVGSVSASPFTFNLANRFAP